MEQIFFYIFAVIAVVAAVSVVVSRNPVHSALFLIVALLQVAAIFVLLRAPFLAAAQVFVYVGAVMVLFLFTVLVLDIGKETVVEYMHSHAFAAVGAVVALFVVLAYIASRGHITVPQGGYTEQLLAKNVEVVGKALFTKYIFPFEVVSLLLLIALVGAIVLVMNEKGRDN
ncbi:MAG: NADH-quinone oxidoreductase subunit J [Thermodesulfobacteriota bacterium]